MAENTNSQNLHQPPPPDPELRRLEPLIGTWRAKDYTQDSILGPGVPVTNLEEFSWLEGGYFLVQTYDTTFGDGKIKVNPDGTISVSWWLRDNHGKWQPWMTNTFTKIEQDV